MYQVKEITKDIYWVGGNDRRIALFENAFPVPRGVSYNSYLVIDKKTILLDTVDKAVSGVFFENLEYLLADRDLDYVVINHMEPDHCASLAEIVLRYPNIKIVGNARTFVMIKNFFDFDMDNRAVTVKEGDTLSTGTYTFSFLFAPMVHWPEVMVAYEQTTKILFSSDAFGTFGALSGNIFADELDFEKDWLPDARRYYTNIVGKYGTQVQTLLKKAGSLEISMICPLHGPVWRKDLSWYVDKYQKWSTYTPENNSIMIAYASVYGNTENACGILAGFLADLGARDIVMYDVSSTHPSIIVSEAFRCSHLVFASTTYNSGIFCNMETALLDIKAHNLQNRTVAVIENGSWAPGSGSLMREILCSMKNMNVLEETLSIESALKKEDLGQISRMAEAIMESMPKPKIFTREKKIDPNAMFKISYGLYLLSASDNEVSGDFKKFRDTACVVNTVTQITDVPKRIAVTVSKTNYTHEIIMKTGLFNVSVLTEDAPFEIFKHYGFRSGRDVNKIRENEIRSENGVVYIREYANAFISGRVIETHEYQTHTEFIAEVTEAAIFSNDPSVTYQYYFDNIKPKPKPQTARKKGYVCKICGYFHEGDLPEGFICPLCKHGVEDFEPYESEGG